MPARAQPMAHPQPALIPMATAGQITMQPTGDGFYTATVMVTAAIPGAVSTPWFMISVPHVKAPEEALPQIHNIFKKYVDQLEEVADHLTPEHH